MATKLSELEAKLTALADQLNKGIDEVVAEVAALKDALANTEIPQTAQDSLDRLTSLVQKLDDLNPDTPPPTP